MVIRMHDVILYTRSGRISPSSNYRLLQYSNDLGDGVVERPMSPEYFYKQHANAKTKLQKLFWYILYYLVIQANVTRYMIKDWRSKPDCIVIQRALSPKLIFPWNKVLIKKALGNCKKLIWDFDDEIFNSGEITKFEANLLQNKAFKIIVTSEFLRSRLSVAAQEKTELMPTTDGEFANESIEEMLSLRAKSYGTKIELLWLATSPSLPHLNKIIDSLDEIAVTVKQELGKELVLHVVCNKPLEYDSKYIVLDNVFWSRKEARRLIRCSHIGIMPLTNTISSKGKGGFKIVQYMSAAMPAIASAIGFNVEIIDDGITGYLVDDIENTDGWKDAILNLAGDWKKYKQFCLNSRNSYNDRFSYEYNLERWKILIKGEQE